MNKEELKEFNQKAVTHLEWVVKTVNQAIGGHEEYLKTNPEFVETFDQVKELLKTLKTENNEG